MREHLTLEVVNRSVGLVRDSVAIQALLSLPCLLEALRKGNFSSSSDEDEMSEGEEGMEEGMMGTLHRDLTGWVAFSLEEAPQIRNRCGLWRLLHDPHVVEWCLERFQLWQREHADGVEVMAKQLLLGSVVQSPHHDLSRIDVPFFLS